MRQGSKSNYDSVSVEEVDWSAESQVLIPAEHLWCDFKCRPWAKNSPPNTNDIWVQSFHTLQNCCNRSGFFFKLFLKCEFLCYHSLKVPFSLLKKGASQYFCPYNEWTYKSLVFGDEFLAQGLHLKSNQRCSAGIMNPRHCHIRIEKAPIQTVAIKLEAHNSLECHYMLKH